MVTHHKASLWPHAVGDSLDPSIRKEDRVLTGDLGYILLKDIDCNVSPDHLT